MRNRPGFSVIIPVYNGEACIADAINSCLSQTVLPVEIIIVDDASSDATQRVVQGFNNPLVHYFRNEKNCGPSFSRNVGIRKASAEWIMFLDSDDAFHPEKIEIIGAYIQHNEAVKAIGHSFSIGIASSAPIPARLPDARKITAKKILFSNPVVTPALAVARTNDIFFNEEMAYAEDHDFILRTAERYGLWYTVLALCSLGRTPLSPGGISSNGWKMRKGEIKMYMDYAIRNHRYLSMPFLVLFSLMKHLRRAFLSPRK